MSFREKMKDGTTRIVGPPIPPTPFDPLTIWPVGSIYFTTTNTNPATYWGGTWAAWGSGRFPVGVDTGQTEFDTVQETGGAKTHSHTLSSGYAFLTLGTGAIRAIRKTVASFTNTWTTTITNGQSTSTADTVATDLGGSSDSSSNLPPYITCYMWRRTA